MSSNTSHCRSGAERAGGLKRPVMFFRTFKEQVVHGRIFQSIDDFRDAVRDFVARYNAEWLIEKNGHLIPTAL